MDSFPIFLIGRLIASAAEPKHKTTISSRDAAGSCQLPDPAVCGIPHPAGDMVSQVASGPAGMNDTAHTAFFFPAVPAQPAARTGLFKAGAAGLSAAFPAAAFQDIHILQSIYRALL